MSELLQIIQKLLGAGQKRAAQRVERLADEVPNVDLQFRPETIESVAQDMRTPMSAMSPRLFEQYAQPLPSEYEVFMRRGDAPKWENVKSLMEDGAPQFDDLPYLSISKQLPYHRRKTFAQTADTFLPRIDSHEGRHRMRGLGGEFGTSALRLFPRSPSLNREIRNLSPDEQLDASIKWLESHEGILPESANGRQDKRLLRPNIFKPFANGGTAPAFDPEGPGYDLPSAQAAGMRPDAEGHMGSVAPTLEEQIYLLLKGRQHPTWDKAVDAENMRGSAVEKRDDGRYYSVPFAPGGGYADGGLTKRGIAALTAAIRGAKPDEMSSVRDLLTNVKKLPLSAHDKKTWGNLSEAHMQWGLKIEEVEDLRRLAEKYLSQADSVPALPSAPLSPPVPSSFGYGWWYDTRAKRLHPIDSGELGPHGDHDGWIGIGDNAKQLSLTPAEQIAARRFQDASYGFEYPKGSDKYYIQGDPEHEKIFARLYPGHNAWDEATRGTAFAQHLVRLRHWPKNAFTIQSTLPETTPTLRTFQRGADEAAQHLGKQGKSYSIGLQPLSWGAGQQEKFIRDLSPDEFFYAKSFRDLVGKADGGLAGYADGGTPGHVHETRPTWTPPSFPELPTIHDLLMKREYTPAIINTLNPLATEGEDPLENTISRIGGLALMPVGTRLAKPVADMAIEAGKRLYGGLSRTAPAAGAVAVMEPDEAEANPLKTKFLDMARAAATPKGTFSPAARAIASAPQDMTGEQWANFLRGRMADVGGQKFPVRPDELEFTGLGELLAQYGTKPIKRSEILDFLRGERPSVAEENAEFARLMTGPLPEVGSPEDLRIQELIDLSRGIKGVARYPDELRLDHLNDLGDRPHYEDYQLPGPRENYAESLTGFPNLEYKAPHFGSRGHGLISHSRMSTRPTVDGGKAVHIDEIQSDLHQKARDEGGYGSPEAIEKLRELDRDSLQLSRERARLKQDEFPAWAREYDAFATKHKIGQIPKEEAEKIPGFLEFRARYDKLSKREQEIDEEFDLLNNERLRLKDAAKRPPRAPYQDRYHEVEFNKALRRAVDEDADVVTWTTGDQQAQRWNQQVQGGVKKLELMPTRMPNGTDLVALRGTKPDGTDFIFIKNPETGLYGAPNSTEQHTLQDLLGNSLAKKLEKEGVLEGENLSLGGGGFKNFYDGTINKYAESWARRFPGAEVKGTKLPAPAGRRMTVNELSDALAEQSEDLVYVTDDRSALSEILSAARRRRETDFLELPDDLASELVGFVRGAHKRAGVEISGEQARATAREVYSRTKQILANTPGYSEVHSLRLTPEMKAWIKQHGTPIMSVAPAAAVGSETLDRIEQLLGERE